MSINTFHIYAPQVHVGGGKVFLQTILENAQPLKNQRLTIDRRLNITENILKQWDVKSIGSSFFHRLLEEFRLKRITNDNDVTLFFSNLPPFFKVRGRNIVFLQNKYLIENPNIKGWSLGKKINFKIQRLWLKYKIKNATQVLVQSASMKHLFIKHISSSVPVSVVPVSKKLSGMGITKQDHSKGYSSFAYIASGDPHKNHMNLIDAWVNLSKASIYPVLHLTVNTSDWPKIHSYLKEKTLKFNLKIVNHGALSHYEALNLISNSDALIYPSLFESFGIPIIEAVNLGKPIIASELDYVRDLVDPIESFNPNSSRSIELAVRRFIGKNENPQKIFSPEEFISIILNDKKI